METALALDRVTSLVLDPGASVLVHGQVTTSVDGSSFDVVMQKDGLSPGAVRPGGLFDLAAGGLRVAEAHADRHEYVLAGTGAPGVACNAAGVASPCLVPRLASLAHERLRTQAELAGTLSGGVTLEGVVAAPPAPTWVQSPRFLSVATLVFTAALVAGVAMAVARARATSTIGRIRAAARRARRATSGDPTLDAVRSQVDAMVGRAATLEKAHRALHIRLRRIDLPTLERKRAAYAQSNLPGAREALEWITAETAEARRLEQDRAEALLGLERIESALRVIALRMREHRGSDVRIEDDPVARAAMELELRSEALQEADTAALQG
jgi:hypothetical protein